MSGNTENTQKHPEAGTATSVPSPQDLGPNAQQVLTALLSQQEELLSELRTAHEQVDQVRKDGTAALSEEIDALRAAEEDRDAAVVESRAAAESTASMAEEARGRAEVALKQLEDLHTQQREQLAAQEEQLTMLAEQSEATEQRLQEQAAQLASYERRLEALVNRIEAPGPAGEKLSAQDERIEQLDANLAETLQRLVEVNERTGERDELIAGLTEQADEKDARLAELNQRVVELETEEAARRSAEEPGEAQPRPDEDRAAPARQRLSPMVENSSAVARFAGRKVKSAASRALRRH